MARKAQRHIKVNYDWEKITTDNLSVYDQDFVLDAVGKIDNSNVINRQVKSSTTKVKQSKELEKIIK